MYYNIIKLAHIGLALSVSYTVMPLRHHVNIVCKLLFAKKKLNNSEAGFYVNTLLLRQAHFAMLKFAFVCVNCADLLVTIYSSKASDLPSTIDNALTLYSHYAPPNIYTSTVNCAPMHLGQKNIVGNPYLWLLAI